VQKEEEMIRKHFVSTVMMFSVASVMLTGFTTISLASDACQALPGQEQLKAALLAATQAEAAVPTPPPPAKVGTGLKNQMWATIVDRDGIVCAVAFTGSNRGAQWPGSRVISAQKANTANSFSLDPTAVSNGLGQPLALSTANLYSAVQPGGSLFGLQESNPVETANAYKGPSSQYGSANDPMVGQEIGGINVFGGGLALYGPGGKILGGVGVSGDTSCTDHNVAWRLRNILNLDFLKGVIGGVAQFANDNKHPDNIIYDITANPDGGTGVSATGFGHPRCLNNPPTTSILGGPPVASGLPDVQ
jgi:uncharacterized protein GlcG (DUF336 family)